MYVGKDDAHLLSIWSCSLIDLLIVLIENGQWVKAYIVSNIFRPDPHQHNIQIAAAVQMVTVCPSSGMVDVIFADVAQPDQTRIVALNAHNFLKNGGHFVISIKVHCLLHTNY